MRIVIFEDEPLLANHLERLVKSILPNCEVVAKLASVRECTAWINSKVHVDLILADIQLSDGVSFKALEQLDDQTPVIFTTAFDEYALKAFRMNSIDYLLKPIQEDELRQALLKLENLKIKYANSHFQNGLAGLLEGKESTTAYKTRFLVYSGKSMLLVQIHEIAFFSKQEIIFLGNLDGKQYVTEYRSLDEIQELINPEVFFRANRQFIIHEKAIDRFETDYMGKIHLKLKGEKTPEIHISKDKASEFKRWLER
jgi:DNA-binding LytR/AlgR family response regulator